MPADFEAIETALVGWVARSTGFPVGRTILAEQGGKRPPLPFATVRHDGGVTPGLLDEERVRDNPTPTPGAEIIVETVGQAEFTATIEVFTSATRGNDAARAVLSRVKNSLSKESERLALGLVGLAVVERGAVQNLTDVLETAFEGRAVLDVRFRVADGTEEATTYIETVEFSSTYD